MKYLIILIVFTGFIACSSPSESKNQVGTILAIYMPDSLKRPSDENGQVALIRAKVEDPDGLNDIDEVYFYSQKPDGSFAGDSSAFYLNNAGELGDITAGDEYYSLGISIVSTNDLGTYKFYFNMVDKADNYATEVVDSIEVY